VFAFLIALWVVALAVSEGAQATTAGRVESGVMFGLFIVLSAAGWWGVSRRRPYLEVGRDAVVYRTGKKGAPFTLFRDPGDTLRILPKFRLYGRVRSPRLVFLGRGGFILLRGFRLDHVRRVCEGQGWRFDGDPALAARDVQTWLHRGQSIEAVQLMLLFGPFPAAVADGEPNTALEAAVYEDIGDKLMGGSSANARDAYRRAAAAQRNFAAFARSAGDYAARAAEAERIEAKTQA
jgi:hypothetical protein